MVDVVVFVTSPLAPGVALSVVATRELGRLHGRDALRLMAGLAPLGPEEIAELEALEALDDADVESDVIEEFEIPDDVAERIKEWLDHGYPRDQEVPELRPEFECLAEAYVAVVGAGDTASLEATRAALAGLRQGAALVRSLHRYRPDVGPRTVVAADLRDARDPGARKALEAIKRRMRLAEW